MKTMTGKLMIASVLLLTATAAHATDREFVSCEVTIAGDQGENNFEIKKELIPNEEYGSYVKRIFKDEKISIVASSSYYKQDMGKRLTVSTKGFMITQEAVQDQAVVDISYGGKSHKFDCKFEVK